MYCNLVETFLKIDSFLTKNFAEERNNKIIVSKITMLKLF